MFAATWSRLSRHVLVDMSARVLSIGSVNSDIEFSIEIAPGIVLKISPTAQMLDRYIFHVLASTRDAKFSFASYFCEDFCEDFSIYATNVVRTWNTSPLFPSNKP
jgi:hypothetical protein